jgi:hypothetical protein
MLRRRERVIKVLFDGFKAFVGELIEVYVKFFSTRGLPAALPDRKTAGWLRENPNMQFFTDASNL